MYELIVFVSGALVMILEMVGSRVLAPYVGTSVTVWTSLIGIILTFLALGSYIGGKKADSDSDTRNLYKIFLGAGIGSSIVALFHAHIGTLALTITNTLHISAILAAILLFALPAFFFGMVTPYIVHAKMKSLDTSGATVGRLYALSTAGSILGTFLGGFVLISFFGSFSILMGVTAATFLLAAFSSRHTIVLTCIAAGCLCVASKHGTYLVYESPYNVMYIDEQENGLYNDGLKTRSLISGRYVQSAIRLDDPDALYLQYSKFYALCPAIVPNAKTVLMLGGGGMSVPKWFLADRQSFAQDATMDVVEIDPLMTEVARKHFFFKDSERITLYHEDGRIFLNKNTKKYDIVFIDVFKEGTVPFHLMTSEAMTRIRNALTDNGVICMNCIAALDSRLFARIYATMTCVFSHVKVFAVGSQKPGKVQNIMVFASQKSIDIQENPYRTQEYNYVMNRDVKPLTDNFAPVDI